MITRYVGVMGLSLPMITLHNYMNHVFVVIYDNGTFKKQWFAVIYDHTTSVS